jgi:hypothetical protein
MDCKRYKLTDTLAMINVIASNRLAGLLIETNRLTKEMITKEIAKKLNIGDEVHYGCSCEHYTHEEMVWLVVSKPMINPNGEDFVVPIISKKDNRIGSIWARHYEAFEEDPAGNYGNYDSFHIPSDCMYWKV